MPDPRIMNAMHETQWNVRYILLEYLTELHVEYQLRPEALFLAVNLIDRYCCRQLVIMKHYQLLGCTALLVATKYGDNRKGHVPSLQQLNHACCTQYNTALFKEMEWNILQVLEWEIGHPDVHTFLRLALVARIEEPVIRHLSMYIAEIALFYREFATTKPSVISRSALAVARYIRSRMSLKVDSWVDRCDMRTFIGLFSHLYHPPRVLFCKYAVQTLSNTSTVVAEYLQHQADMVMRSTTVPKRSRSEDPRMERRGMQKSRKIGAEALNPHNHMSGRSAPDLPVSCIVPREL